MTDTMKLAAAKSGELRLELLGGFCLRAGPNEFAVADASQRLLAFLALNSGKALPRAMVAGSLWPDKSERRAFANLRSCLWRLNGDNPCSAVATNGSTVMLSKCVRVDVADLERGGWELLSSQEHGDTSARLDPTDLLGELLPGWYDDWVLAERERLAQLQIRILEEYVARLRSAGQYARAIDLAMRLVSKDPFRERSQLALIVTLANEGSWGRALRQQREFEQLLDEEFGCRPSAAFRAGCADVMSVAA